MQSAVKKSTALVATAAVVGFSSLFALASPANAAPAGCSQGATLLANNVCELRLTTVGTSYFTPSAEMSQLEVLLVAGGGDGSADQGYGGGGGGGGGQVKVVGFGSDPTTQLELVVGGANIPSRASQGATVVQALPGVGGTSNFNGGTGSSGGMSGSGFGGSMHSGGGAGASPANIYDGGAPVIVSSIAPTGSLFSDDPSCYGEGGAFGIFGGTYGTATCGGGVVAAGPTGVTAVAPTPNSGGGGAGGSSAGVELRGGASGLVVLRWVPVEVTVSFGSNGHGASVASQTFARGGTVTKPTDPTAAGFAFNGWFADAALTIPVDFLAPVTASTTYHASWSAVAPVTVTVTFAGNGHGGIVTPQTIAVGGKVVKPADPTAAGFIFKGWFSNAALTTPVDFSAPVTASTTYYASWSAVAPVTVTITFSNGHGGTVTQTLTPGETVTPPADPTADGFIFNGWYTDAALTTRVDFSVPVTATATFYASWSAVTPTPTPTPTPSPTATAAPAAVDPELARTGASLDPATVPVGLAALGLGLGLIVLGRRRAHKAN